MASTSGAVAVASASGTPYAGTSLIRNPRPVGDYSRTIPRALWWPEGGYERGTPVHPCPVFLLISASEGGLASTSGAVASASGAPTPYRGFSLIRPIDFRITQL